MNNSAKPGRPKGSTKNLYESRRVMNVTLSRDNYLWLKALKRKGFIPTKIIDKALELLRGKNEY